MMARILATFYIAAGFAGLFAVVGPGAAGSDGRGVIAGLSVFAFAAGGVTFRWAVRWPRHVFHWPVASAALLVALGVGVSPDPATAMAAASIMAFVAVDACFFFSLPLAWAHLLFGISAVTAALMVQGDVPASIALALDTVIVALGTVTRGLVIRASSASRDPLTGLANRRGFDDALQELLGAANRTGEPLSAALLDLDHFKRINDTDGHEAGDRVLIRVAEAWRADLPAGAVLARHGGDEFALLMPGLSGPAALAEVEQLSALHPDVGVSCGVAQHVPGDSAAQLMRRADAALYVAKDAGRGRSALDGATASQLSADLATAVAAGRIEVAFQPLVQLEEGGVFGVEALARWTHPERGPVPPDEFIPLAEQRGLMGALGEHVLRTSLARDDHHLPAPCPVGGQHPRAGSRAGPGPGRRGRGDDGAARGAAPAGLPVRTVPALRPADARRRPRQAPERSAGASSGRQGTRRRLGGPALLIDPRRRGRHPS